jgi:hypothetical protein
MAALLRHTEGYRSSGRSRQPRSISAGERASPQQPHQDRLRGDHQDRCQQRGKGAAADQPAHADPDRFPQSLEQVNEEIKPRTRVVGIFPNDAPITRLVGAVLLEQHEHRQLEGRRVVSAESMAAIPELEDLPTLLSAAAGEETLRELAASHGQEVATHLYGQEITPETYAACKADMLLKGEGENANNTWAARHGQPSRTTPSQRRCLMS